MTMERVMQVRIQLPDRTLFEGAVTALDACGHNGAFGVLPNHVDLVTALVPSVLLVRLGDGLERIFGIDEGLLVKQSHEVRVAVRRGLEGDDLLSLHHTVDTVFAEPVDDERVARTALSRLEAGIVRRFISLRRPDVPDSPAGRP